MFSNIKNKLLSNLQESMQNSLDRFKSLYYEKGFDYLEKSERIVLILNRIEKKYNLEDKPYDELYHKIKTIQNEIDALLVEMKKEMREEFIHFQVNSKLKKYLSGGQIN